MLCRSIRGQNEQNDRALDSHIGLEIARAGAAFFPLQNVTFNIGLGDNDWATGVGTSNNVGNEYVYRLWCRGCVQLASQT